MYEHYQSDKGSRGMGRDCGGDVVPALRAFQVDPGWYEAYWYGRAEAPRARGRARALLEHGRKLMSECLGWLARWITENRPEQHRAPLGQSERPSRQARLRHGTASRLPG